MSYNGIHAFNPEKDTPTIREELRQNQIWANIRKKAKTDPGLQDLMDKCIMYYMLTEDNDGSR